MRTLKFRVWDKQRNNMLKYPCSMGQGFPCPIESYDFMQFTGLTGQEQREIYEGDICRWRTSDGSVIGSIIWEQQACAFWFKWFDGAAHRYRELRVTFSDGELWLNDNIQVIGNIYEHSNLINP